MDNPVTAGSYVDLGHIYCRNGKYTEALAQYRKAKVIRESILGKNHPDTALTYMYVGKALTLGGDYEAALTVHQKALVVFESVLGENHPRTAAGYQLLADALLANGHAESALTKHRKALQIRKSLLSKDHPDTAESCSRIGDVLLNHKGPCNLTGALSLYREALGSTVGRCGKDHPESAIARINVARALTAIGIDKDNDNGNDSDNNDNGGVLEEAQTKLQEALKVLIGMGNSGELDDVITTAGAGNCAVGDEVATGRAFVTLGILLEMKAKKDDSYNTNTNKMRIHDLYTEGVQRLTKILGEDHPETQAAQTQLLAHSNVGGADEDA